jgi:hypothetical protein
MAVVAWVSMVIAGSLGWTLVQTYHVGIKPALTRPDRPSREPELDELEPFDAAVPADAAAARDLDDPFDGPGRNGATAAGRIHPPSLRH